METKMNALDTETVNRPGGGHAVLITKAGPDGEGVLEFPETLEETFAFLKGGRYMAWNMDFDARALIHEKFLPYKNLEELAVTGHTVHRGMNVKYVPSKFLRVADARDSFEVYDLAQFYGMRLKDAAAKYLEGAGKDEIPHAWYNEMDACLLDARRDKVVAYGLQDARLVARLFEIIRGSFEGLGVRPHRWISPASVAVELFKDVLEEEPPVPLDVQHYFRRAFYGGRIEVRGLGALPEGAGLALYDINSAYPAEIAQLSSLRGLSLQRLRREHDRGFYGGRWARYGAYHVELEIPTTWVWGPVAVRQKREIIYPVGKFKTWLGLPALNMLFSMSGEGVRVKLLEGLQYVGEHEPLFRNIGDIFALRKDPRISLAAKLVLNSLYGKLCETREDHFLGQAINGVTRWHGFQEVHGREVFGRYARFPLAAHITESVRCRLFEKLHSAGTNAYMAMTDAALMRGEIPPGPGLGQWSRKMTVDRGAIFGPGRYWLEGWKGDGKPANTFHFRGFAPTKENLNILRTTKTPTAQVADFRAASISSYTRGGGVDDLNVLRHEKLFFNLRDKKRYYTVMPPTIADCFTTFYAGEPWEGVCPASKTLSTK